MNTYKKNMSILFLSIALVACSKSTGIKSLDELLVDTQTVQKERTQEWYSNQDRIRADVLNTCTDHFKSEILNKANNENPNLPRIVYDMNQIEQNFEKIPDCNNALVATNLIIQKEYESRTIYDSQVDEAKNNFNATTTEDEIERLAAVVAHNLLKDQQGTEKSGISAEQHAEEYLAPEGKLDQIMQINDETLTKADQALSEFTEKSN